MDTTRAKNETTNIEQTDTDERTSSRSLIRLEDSGLRLSDAAEDVRGHKVIDSDGERIGKVSGLYVDGVDHKVRFLEVSAGGFLGIGEKTFMVPVDAVTKIHDDHVHLGHNVQHVIGSPEYVPDLERDPQGWERYWTDIYAHYEYPPYWTAGYLYPGYPFY